MDRRSYQNVRSRRPSRGDMHRLWWGLEPSVERRRVHLETLCAVYPIWALEWARVETLGICHIPRIENRRLSYTASTTHLYYEIRASMHLPHTDNIFEQVSTALNPTTSPCPRRALQNHPFLSTSQHPQHIEQPVCALNHNTTAPS